MLSSGEISQEGLILSLLSEGGEEFTSGEALSDKLGLSRAAVWKYVEALRQKGYRIDALPARGYRLVEVPDRLTSLELGPLLSTRDIGSTIHSFEQVTSTNDVAQKLAQEGARHGEVVVAESQTAGKGRRGRNWTSPPGLNLTFSVVLRPNLPPHRAPEITLVAAVALAQTLRESHLAAAIKWPNDVEVEGRKIAGILTELSAEADQVHHVVLGIGVNLNAPLTAFPPEVRETATSLLEERGRKVPRALFAAALFSSLEMWLDRHEDEGFEPIRVAWKEMSSTLGQEVLVKTERTEMRGVAEDIGPDGALWVRTSDGKTERVLAGDVMALRPSRTAN